MKARCTMVLALGMTDAAQAREALRCLQPDDPGAVALRVEASSLVVEAGGAPLGALRTVDDVLGCLRAAFPDI